MCKCKSNPNTTNCRLYWTYPYRRPRIISMVEFRSRSIPLSRDTETSERCMLLLTELTAPAYSPLPPFPRPPQVPSSTSVCSQALALSSMKEAVFSGCSGRLLGFVDRFFRRSDDLGRALSFSNWMELPESCCSDDSSCKESLSLIGFLSDVSVVASLQSCVLFH